MPAKKRRVVVPVVALIALLTPLAFGDPPSAVPEQPPPREPEAAALAPVEVTSIRSVTLSCSHGVAQQRYCDSSGACQVARAPCFPYSCDRDTRTCAGSCTASGERLRGMDRGYRAKGTCAHGAQCVRGECEPAIPVSGYGAETHMLYMPDGTTENCYPYTVDETGTNCIHLCDTTADCAGSLICTVDHICDTRAHAESSQ